MNAWPAIALATIAGCTWGTPPPPTVVGVSPSTIMAGREGLLTVEATGLGAQTTVDFDDPERSPACAGFRVVLRAPGGILVELQDVARVAADRLRGRIPATTDRAVYDVSVLVPGGREATLAAAFAVEKCPPPFAACDDGNSCTEGDSCLGADRCSSGTPLADGTPCAFDCPWNDAPVSGSCATGRCTPAAGACPSAPAACLGE